MKMKYLVILSSFFLLQACAGRNVEDFNNEQTQEHIAKAQREQGTWMGSLVSSDGRLMAGVSFDNVEPDTEAGIGGASNSGAQQVGLMGTIKLTTADGSILNYGFRAAAYDVSNRVMRLTNNFLMPDGRNATLEIEATFSDTLMTGRIWSGGWEQYGGVFTARRNGVVPAGSALSSGRSSMPVARDYVATVPNPNSLDPSESATEPAVLRILDVPNSDPRFLDFLSPLVDVDLELTLGSVTAGTSTINTVIYKSAQLNEMNGTLIGHADGVSTLSDLTCTQDGTGWDCTLNSARALNMQFKPRPQ
jgi:hypothetical protein